MRSGSIIIFHLITNLWKAKFSILCDANISGEAAGEIWNWSLLGVTGLKWSESFRFVSSYCFLCLMSVPKCQRLGSRVSIIFVENTLTSCHAWWGNHQAELRVQRCTNHGNPAQPTTRTPVTLIISGELHSILIPRGVEGGEMIAVDQPASNPQWCLASESEWRIMCCMLSHGHGIMCLQACNGRWWLTADWHCCDVNFP